MPDGRPDFGLKVAPNGYAWWYVDGLSHDGAHGLTIIGFIGSVFSPYYKAARRGGRIADPQNHCALNVALYSRGAARWAMTERARGQLERSRDFLRIGPSEMQFDERGLTIQIDEKAFPFIAPVRGTIRVIPEALPATLYAMDDAGRHAWQPIAPTARIEVEMRAPALSWSGTAYFDHNHGSEPIEDGFSEWDWSRSDAGRSCLVHYDTRPRAGAPRAMALRFTSDGRIEELDAPPRQRMQDSFWRIARHARSDGHDSAQVMRTLEDAPFYARSVIRSKTEGQMMLGVHESLSLDRFNNGLVQRMLPFRMPRAGNSQFYF